MRANKAILISELKTNTIDTQAAIDSLIDLLQEQTDLSPQETAELFFGLTRLLQTNLPRFRRAAENLLRMLQPTRDEALIVVSQALSSATGKVDALKPAAVRLLADKALPDILPEAQEQLFPLLRANTKACRLAALAFCEQTCLQNRDAFVLWVEPVSLLLVSSHDDALRAAALRTLASLFAKDPTKLAAVLDSFGSTDLLLLQKQPLLATEIMHLLPGLQKFVSTTKDLLETFLGAFDSFVVVGALRLFLRLADSTLSDRALSLLFVKTLDAVWETQDGQNSTLLELLRLFDEVLRLLCRNRNEALNFALLESTIVKTAPLKLRSQESPFVLEQLLKVVAKYFLCWEIENTEHLLELAEEALAVLTVPQLCSVLTSLSALSPQPGQPGLSELVVLLTNKLLPHAHDADTTRALFVGLELSVANTQRFASVFALVHSGSTAAAHYFVKTFAGTDTQTQLATVAYLEEQFVVGTLEKRTNVVKLLIGCKEHTRDEGVVRLIEDSLFEMLVDNKELSVFAALGLALSDVAPKEINAVLLEKNIALYEEQQNFDADFVVEDAVVCEMKKEPAENRPAKVVEVSQKSVPLMTFVLPLHSGSTKDLFGACEVSVDKSSLCECSVSLTNNSDELVLVGVTPKVVVTAEKKAVPTRLLCEQTTVEPGQNCSFALTLLESVETFELQLTLSFAVRKSASLDDEEESKLVSSELVFEPLVVAPYRFLLPRSSVALLNAHDFVQRWESLAGEEISKKFRSAKEVSLEVVLSFLDRNFVQITDTHQTEPENSSSSEEETEERNYFGVSAFGDEVLLKAILQERETCNRIELFVRSNNRSLARSVFNILT